MENNFSDMYRNWLNSNKLKSFLNDLDKNREEKMRQVLETKTIANFKPQLNMTDKQIEEILNSILEFQTLTIQEKDEIEFTTACINAGKTKKKLFFEFIKTITNWHYYLKRSLLKENYELASKLRDVINIDIKEFYMYMNKYRNDFEPEDEQLVHESIDAVKKQFNI